MRSHARVWLLALFCGVLIAGVLPVAAQAEFGVKAFTATNCYVSGCAGEEFPSGFPESGPVWVPKEPTHGEAVEQGFLQAGGRVPFGVTDFEVKTEGTYPNENPSGAPVTHVRVDVASGLATAPVAVPGCEEFGKELVLGETHTGLFSAPNCPESQIGSEKVTLYFGPNSLGAGVSDLPVEGNVYNLPQPEGLASLFGAALKLPKFVTEAKLGASLNGSQPGIEKAQYYAHGLVKGNVEWGQEAKGTNAGDYHDYFEVEVNPAAGELISSRQVLEGTAGEEENFITNATSCPGDNTTFVTLENAAKEVVREKYTTPIGLKGCNVAAEKAEIEKLEGEGAEEINQVPFSPTFSFSSGNTLTDQPNQITTIASVPNEGNKIAQSQVKTASITLPEGMTLDPSAAHGLEACTPAQARIHSSTFGVACPEGSTLGTVSLNVPTLPDGSFTGNVYLGGPESGPITGSPYTAYVVANSKRYGVSVRVKAQVIPNPVTGQVTTVFNENPEQPFTNLAINFNRGVLTSVANPLICGTPKGSSSFVPTTGTPAVNAEFGVEVTGCAATIPFALSQSTEDESLNGGGHTSWTYNLGRPEGNQYLQEVKTVLPPGLVGAIPDVTLCGEPQASKGECTGASRIGSVTVASGSGSSPYTFTGSAYMTGPYNGAPYGLSIVVPAIAGPFNLGNVVSRATININPPNAQVTSDAVLPTIVQGIPIRLRSLTVNVNRQGFLYNPTNCSTPSTTTSELTSTEKTVEKGLSSSFQLANCTALSFAPKFAATTTAKTSRVNGASLVTTLTQGSGQSNIKSVKVQLPKALPSRLTTLQKACTETQFAANPAGCPAASKVGTATVVTPTLPGKMTGPAYFVSHGGAAFPDLDLVVEDQGVKVILVGNTDIKNGITTTTFASTPDVPVTSVSVNLPTGPNSALGAVGDLCVKPLVMPTTIIGQNGKTTKQNTVIAVSSCGVHIVGHKIVGKTAYLTVRTYAAGRITGSGSGVSTVSRSLGGATKAATLKVPLSSRGRSKHKPLKVKIRVGFVPKKKGAHSTASVTVTFR
jgi:hypothetical protein